MGIISRYARLAIGILEAQIEAMGFTPVVHFELEGTYAMNGAKAHRHVLDFDAVNAELAAHPIQGLIKPEFWPCQWEWASQFEGQGPLKTAADLEAAMKIIPVILLRHGCDEVFIRPVMWNGVQGKMAAGSRKIFGPNESPVHIPNSIQVNISALNRQDENAIPENGLGERLQECLLKTSYECCLLYSPEEEAFERLSLKKKYDLALELSSPQDISGGHQGSIALYKELGKHNQKIGETPQLYDAESNVVATTQDWRPLSRVEHRLGSASLHYNPYANVAFALANLSDAIMLTQGDFTHLAMMPKETHTELPASLFGDKGAYALFRDSTWFEGKLNACADYARTERLLPTEAAPANIGGMLKKAMLDYYFLSASVEM